MRFLVQHAVGDPAWRPEVLAPRAVAGFARAAEQAGFSALGFTDHPAPSAAWVQAGGEGSADLFSALGFCAAVTESIRLVTFVLVLPYRNPLLAAHGLATLDRLSDGRLVVGVGTGYLRSEVRALGGDPDGRLEAFDTAWETIEQAWRGEPVTASGPGWSARGVVVPPPRVQQPRPPLWVHGNSRFGTERAARRGQGWIAVLGDARLTATIRTPALPDLDALERHIDALRAATEAAGRRPEDVEVVVAGAWPVLDVRTGWSRDRLQEDVAQLAARGVDWAVVLPCGDDGGAARDTVLRFGEDVIAPG